MRLSGAHRRIQGSATVLASEVLRFFGTSVRVIPPANLPINVVTVGRERVVCGHIPCSGKNSRTRVCPHSDTCAGDCKL